MQNDLFPEHTSPAWSVVREGVIHPLIDWVTPTADRLFFRRPSVAIVVGTFAAVPYVHLQLEARLRFYADVPLLVQDDCSPHGAALESLCKRYGAEFSSTSHRFPPVKGDITSMVHGQAWAEALGKDLLVKLSRRFVPRTPWVEELSALADRAQYATYSSWTTSFRFGFRTEAVAFAVETWKRLGLRDALIDAVMTLPTIMAEAFVHKLAIRAAAANCLRAKEFDAEVGHRPPERNGYAPWPFLGTDRRIEQPGFLWHDWARPSDYAALAETWNLPYRETDFRDPNMGSGRTPPTTA